MSYNDRIRKLKQISLYAGLGILLLGLSLYLFTDYKFVDTVTISGNYYVNDQEIISQSGLYNDQLFLAIDEHKIELLVRSHPVIKSVDIKKQFPNDIEIKVQEHKIVGCLVNDDEYIQLFSNAYHTSVQSLTNCEGAIITGGNPYFNEHLLDEFARKFEEVDEIMLSLISETIYSPTDFNEKRLISYMTDGNKVIYSIDTIDKLNYYTDMVHQLELSYNTEVNGVFDLEVGAYFTPYEPMGQ